MGIPFSGPALLHAEKACKEYLPPGGPPPAVSESERAAAIANAECMRKHGVPNFPDPTFSGGQLNAGLGGVNPQSPAFKQAAAACGGAGGRGQRFKRGAIDTLADGPSTRSAFVERPQRATAGRACRRMSVALAAVTSVVLITACGSSRRAISTTAAGASAQGVAYSDCMRSHGVPNIPDLNPNGSVNLPSGINPQAPAFQTAQQSCASLRPGAGSPPPPISLAQQKSFVANAQCVRKHGVPNFPDPVFGAGGQGIGYNVPPGSLANQAQGVLEAEHTACAHVGTPLPLRELLQAAP